MYSFLISSLALILGYILYGKVVEKVFGIHPEAVTPAIANQDGVDYVPMAGWKTFMIQFLNIAGTGPIFGAIMGAKFGPSCYLWIVFGCIFAGGVHDFISGMMSTQHKGGSLPWLIGSQLGNKAKNIALVFIMGLMMLVGAVFVYSPALILGDIAGLFASPRTSIMFWVLVIFAYYIVATLLPIDKLIGRIYPLFAFALIFMAVGLFVCLLVKWPSLPEFWQGLGNRAPSVGVEGQSIFPCLFITVACGAISGFHATQSPMMARCIKSEKLGRPIFYGSMITEGIVALVWAAVSSYFFFDGGMAEVGAHGAQAPEVVTSVAKSWLGILGGILAILGVVAAPITSGDTAFRSARLILSDAFKLDQRPVKNRLMLCLPLFAASAFLLWFNIANEDGFNVIWRYFGWLNQTLACLTLWAESIYFVKKRKWYGFLIPFIPAVFMSSVCVTFICVDKIGFGIPSQYAIYIALATAILFGGTFLLHEFKMRRSAFHVPYVKDIDTSDKAAIDKVFEDMEINDVAVCNWPDEFPYIPKAGFRMFHNGNDLVIRYDVTEAHIGALAAEDNGDVYKDSCMEFFFQPYSSGKYYNLESSCIGKVLLAFRPGRENPEYATQEVMDMIKRFPSAGTEPFAEREGGDWDLTLVVPAACCFGHKIDSWKGVSGRFNAYKCGDGLTTPHFLSYTPVKAAHPDFHRPECFTDIVFD